MTSSGYLTATNDRNEGTLVTIDLAEGRAIVVELDEVIDALAIEIVNNGGNGYEASLVVGHRYGVKRGREALIFANAMMSRPELQDAVRLYDGLTRARDEQLKPRIVAELAKVAMADASQLFTRGEDGKSSVLRDPSDWPDNIRSAVASIEATRTGGLKVKMHGKIQAIELLMKHYRMFEGHEGTKSDLETLLDAVAERRAQSGNRSGLPAIGNDGLAHVDIDEDD